MFEAKRLAVKAVLLAPLLAAGLFVCAEAYANDCASQCYAQENACRRATQGSSSCDSALTRCLQSCRAQK